MFPISQSLQEPCARSYPRFVRISKAYVVGTSFVLAFVGLIGMGVILISVQRDLEATRGTVDELQQLSSRQRGKITTLEDRLGRVGKQLLDFREVEAKERSRLLRELRSSSGSEAEAVRRELDTLKARVTGLKKAAETHAAMLAAARANNDVKLRYRELMSPTVRVNARHEVGSGTILWSKSTGKRARTFVLTAWHIVQDNMTSEGSIPLEVDFYEAGELQRTETGKIVARQESLDLALLEIKGYHVYPHKARIPALSQLPKILIFSKVYAIGCPLGYSPLPTSGELTSKDKELEGNHYWMINAPTIFGNSGGGIYVADSRTLIGVLSRISAYKNMIDVAVPHMGLVTPMDKVYGWLDRTPYPFVYKDRLRELSKAKKKKTKGTKGAKALKASKKKKN